MHQAHAKTQRAFVNEKSDPLAVSNMLTNLKRDAYKNKFSDILVLSQIDLKQSGSQHIYNSPQTCLVTGRDLSLSIQ